MGVACHLTTAAAIPPIVDERVELIASCRFHANLSFEAHACCTGAISGQGI